MNFEKSDEKSTFRGWLWTISRNKARDSHRRHAKQFHATGGTDSLRLLESIQETEPIDSDDSPGRELVRRALELIRPEFETHTWNAFERMVLDGWSAAHTASELKMKPNAVHQARFRILRRLRLELSGLEDLRIYAD